MPKINYFSKKHIIVNGYNELNSLKSQLVPSNDINDLIALRRKAYYVKDKYGWNENFKKTCFDFIHGLNSQMRQMTLVSKESE